MPEVENVSRSLLITSVGNYWGTRMKYQDPLDSTSVHYNTIDENYIPLHKVKLIAGKNFTPLPDSVDESEVIVNTEILKRFNIANQDPQKAINEMVTLDRKKMKIVGVVSNFHYGKAEGNSTEMIFRYLKRKPNWVNVKINTKDWPATFAKIESAWKKMDDVHPLQAQLYKDKIAYSYREIAAMLKMMGFLGFLAICIASLGLLGMVIFITEIRLKEVSIRKVLGASEATLIYLLGKGFLFLLIIAGMIALPATYLFIDRIFFTEMQNHISITLFDLTIGFLGVMIFALLLIGSQTLKAARTNPSEVLKNE
jgi:ABC-type antimicrobial peptide transport system permease subunit